jgi:NADPH:quinone reductase-like Zn-dependent oxidoreductase
MRAIGLENFEAGPKLLDIPRPDPGRGEVLVDGRATSINGMDAVVAAGMLKDMMEHRFPVVLGRDFAGIVTAVGEGVSQYQVGDEVFGTIPMKEYIGDGTFADCVVVSEDNGIAKIPSGLNRTEIAALGLAGTAATQSIDAVAPTSGEVVLISGATGGVGTMAIQLAKQRGSEVIATARPGEGTELAKDLGADHVVDFTADLEQQVRSIRPDGVDAVLHFAGDAAVLAQLVRPQGVLASTLGVGADQLADFDVRATSVMATQPHDQLELLANEVVAGRLRIPLRRKYELEEVPKALDDFRSGSVGKVGVTIN